ncbi:MAG: DUF302 domain-containing protein [Candidatus Paceibacterota bacterium]
MSYGYTQQATGNFSDITTAVQEALAREGFGVLSNIDVKDTLKKKLGVDQAPYQILGACNPKLAHQALSLEPELGLLLPCNVIIYEQDEKVFISAVDPEILLGVTDNEELYEIATEVKERLRRVVDAVANK